MHMLFNLSLSKPIKGFGKPSVKAVLNDTGILGYNHKETRELLIPHWDSIRDCLPHYYRKAFNRVRLNQFWYDQTCQGSEIIKPCYIILRDSKGYELNRVYFMPYYYRDGVA